MFLPRRLERPASDITKYGAMKIRKGGLCSTMSRRGEYGPGRALSGRRMSTICLPELVSRGHWTRRNLGREDLK